MCLKISVIVITSIFFVYFQIERWYIFMNNRMNKEELIGLINSLNLDNSDYCVLSSSSLVIREIYPDACDLDLAVNIGIHERRIRFL